MTPLSREAFIHLSRAGPCTAAELAKALDIHRNQAYRVTSTLMSRGMIQQTLDRPMRFVAEPLETVAERMQEEAERQFAVLERIDDSALQRHRELQVPHLRMLAGREACYLAMQGLAEGAEHRLDFMDTSTTAARNLAASGLCHAVDAARRRGVATRCILGESPPVAHQGAHQVIRTHERVRFMVADHRAAVIFAHMDDGGTFRKGDDRAFWTDAEHLVSAFELLFDRTWTPLITPEW